MKQAIEEAQKLVKLALNFEGELNDWAAVPDKKLGDFAIPCFKLAKQFGKAPPMVAKEAAEKLAGKLDNLQFVKSVSPVGPYLNFFVKTEALFKEYSMQFQKDAAHFGSSQLGIGKRVVIDYSSPNIAKEIGLHHLRSTAIGDSLARIAQHHGYKVEKINYLGDWGTNHGKLICGLQMFGDESLLEKEGLAYMLSLYVRFNQEEKKDPELSTKAKAMFQKLESGDAECRRVWKLFRDISLREFKKLYENLGIHFDHYDSESMYESKLTPAIEELRAKLGTRISEGAEVLDLPGFKIPVLLRKNDGASLYIMRDIAAIEDRFNRFAFDEAWYVVAIQQKLHFEQLFKIVEMLGKVFTSRMTHVSFGMLSFGDKTMKSREGNIIFLEDVLEESKQRALNIIKEKNADLPNAERIAEMVGYGAIKFFDLSQNRTHDIAFSWDKALNFEGDTAPFIQYTHARCHSLVHKALAQLKTLSPSSDIYGASVFDIPSVHQLTLELGFFEFACARALKDKDPSQIATSLINISRGVNHFYHSVRLKDETNAARLQSLIELTRTSAGVLKVGLDLLGIEAPDRM